MPEELECKICGKGHRTGECYGYGGYRGAPQQHTDEEWELLNKSFRKQELLKLIDYSWQFDEVISHAKEKNIALDKEIVLKLLERGMSREVVDHLDIFEGLDTEVALRLITDEKIFFMEEVINNRNKFEGFVLDKKVALFLIHRERSLQVVRHIDKFEGLNRAVAMALLNTYHSHNDFYLETFKTVLENIDRFEGFVLDKKVALLIIGSDESNKLFVSYIDKFEGLDTEVAIKLMKFRCGNVIIEHIDKFEGLNLNKDCALLMIEHNCVQLVIDNIDKFEGFVLDKELALRLIKNGKEWAVLHNMDKFQGITWDKEIAHIIIESPGDKSFITHKHLDQFEGLNEKSDLDQNQLENYPQELYLTDALGLLQKPQIGPRILEALRTLTSWNYRTHIKPILASQGDAAFLYLESIKNFDPNARSEEEMRYITSIAKRFGTRARSILEEFFVYDEVEFEYGEFKKEMLFDFKILKKYLVPYMEEIGIIHADLFSSYVKGITSGKSVEHIKKSVEVIQHSIYSGNSTKKIESDPYYAAIQYHTFPPAIGVARDHYAQLNQNRPDYPEHIPEQLTEFQDIQFGVPTGKYELKEGEALNLDSWERLSTVIRSIHKELNEKKGEVEKDIPETHEVGARLVGLFHDLSKKDNKAADRESALFDLMYRYRLSKGDGRLPEAFELNMQGLMQYKEFIGDSVKNDLVRECLGAWRERNPQEFEKLSKNIVNRVKGDQTRIIGEVLSRLKGLRKIKDFEKRTKSETTLDELLADYGLSYGRIKDMKTKDIETWLSAETIEGTAADTQYSTDYRTEEFYNSPEFLGALEQFDTKRNPDPIVVTEKYIASSLAGPINKSMRKEVEKFDFTDNANEKTKTLLWKSSKRRAHGVAGYTMGVCVTPDEKLWEDPTFWNELIFDPETRQCQGGMHILHRKDTIYLPGINPSQEVLGVLKDDMLYARMIDRAKIIAQSVGATKLRIPTDPAIHSNRQQFLDIIRTKNYATVKLDQTEPFSYSPFPYDFDACFEVPMD